MVQEILRVIADVRARTDDFHRTVEKCTQTSYLNINMLVFEYGNCKLNFGSFELL
jgi:hypothetical protein